MLITRDLAEENDLHVGDPIVLADPTSACPSKGASAALPAIPPTTRAARSTTRWKLPGDWPAGQPAINLALVLAADPAAVAQNWMLRAGAQPQPNGWPGATLRPRI